jgi:hypothetical protein
MALAADDFKVQHAAAADKHCFNVLTPVNDRRYMLVRAAKSLIPVCCDVALVPLAAA